MRLILFFFLLTSFAVSGQTYNDYTERAARAFGTKDYAYLASLYDTIFSKFKAEPIDYYNAACANSMIGQLPRAMQHLRKAFEKGFTNFDLMYYDKDLNPLRKDPSYMALEKQYRPESAVFFFDILRQLKDSNTVEICDKRISLTEPQLYLYSLEEIMDRVGFNLPITSDSLIDFSTKSLTFCRSRFDDNDDSFNMITRMSLKELAIDDSQGPVALVHLKIGDLWLDKTAERQNNLQRVIIDDVTVNGLVMLEGNGVDFYCANSTFNVNIAPDQQSRSGFQWDLEYDAIQVVNTTFNSAQQQGELYPLEFGFTVNRLKLEGSKFNFSTRLRGTVSDVLTVRQNSFPKYLDITKLNLPDFDCYFPFKQLSNSQLVRFDYVGNDFSLKGDSIAEYSDDILYDDVTGLYKRLYDHYRGRADISSANKVYVLMKDLEIAHLKSMENRGTEETIRLRLNQLMGFYTDHATSPGKALIISFYIILAFGVFYCFFPSDWDKTSKEKIIADFRLFIEKNEHGYVKPFFKMMRGLWMSLLNAVALSLNAFITLGFGNIPTTGIARYVCVLQGALGWFLLSLFTVALLNQVLL